MWQPIPSHDNGLSEVVTVVDSSSNEDAVSKMPLTGGKCKKSERQSASKKPKVLEPRKGGAKMIGWAQEAATVHEKGAKDKRVQCNFCSACWAYPCQAPCLA